LVVISMQAVTAEEMQIQVIERKKQIELESKEIERREKELVATVKKQAEAERFAQEQRAEGDRYQIEARAKAEAKDKIADALRKYGEAAIIELIMQKFPEIARAIAEPLSKTEKIVIVDGGGSGPNGGAGKVMSYVTADLLAKMPETVGALLGVDVQHLIRISN
jgi:flotillin